MRPGGARGFPRTPVSIVTISSALASGGDVIGRALAEELTYTFADREFILKAAERLGQGVAELERLLESRPTLRERLLETRRDYLAAVEAVIWEFAARDNVVLVGRGSTFVLQRIRHAFRLRVTAPVHVRARRLEAERGLVPDAEEVIARHGLGAHVATAGAKGSVIYSTEPMRTYRDFLRIDGRYAVAAWLYQFNRGVFLPPWAKGEQWLISVQHSEEDIDRYLGTLDEFAGVITR